MLIVNTLNYHVIYSLNPCSSLKRSLPHFRRKNQVVSHNSVRAIVIPAFAIYEIVLQFPSYSKDAAIRTPLPNDAVKMFTQLNKITGVLTIYLFLYLFFVRFTEGIFCRLVNYLTLDIFVLLAIYYLKL